jgi:hypothetical protein
MGGLSAALVPILAVILLPVRDYGAFSFVYLVFAQGWSIELSAVCDTWARRRAAGYSAGSWGAYTGALATISGVSALVTLLVALPMFGSPVQAVAMAVGVGTSLYRQAARYHQAAVHGARAVLPSDTAAVLVFLLALASLHAMDYSLLTSLLVAWALSGPASAAFFMRGALGDGGLRAWYRRNRSTVRSLLGESLLMDAGAAGTPVLIAPILGLHNFGIYRSVSSLSVPIQMLIDPIRPNLAQMLLHRVASTRVVAVAFSIAAVLAGGAYVALAYIVPIILSFSPVLMALSDFALACSLFVAFQFLTYVFHIFARIHVSHRRLLLGRAFHTVFAILLPLLGAIFASVTGALWCFVATSGLTVAIWLSMLVSTSRRHSEQMA